MKVYQWTSYQCAQAHWICQIWMWGAVWGDCQPQPWHNDIIFSPQVTQNSESQYLIQVGWVYLWKAPTVCWWTSHQCAQTLCICLRWMWEAVCRGYQPQQWHNHIISTPHKWPRTPKSEQDDCVRLLLYADGQHINVLEHFGNVLVGWGEQFELAVSLNHDIMTPFWLHKWPRTPKSEPLTENEYYSVPQRFTFWRFFLD